ncbi:unnamed protein product [Rotaria sp. Silwood2]|nr:unnamed protein product [Rotaria sp. Silwood2]CAF4338820.1 unnamed protein product [Rotaria sp. Silwood2]
MCLQVDRSRGFLDLNYLMNNVLSSLGKLKRLNFFINSNQIFPKEVDLSILQGLEEVFHVGPDVGITAYADYFLEAQCAQYHFDFIPLLYKYLSGSSNRFPGGKFPPVGKISLIDEKTI